MKIKMLTLMAGPDGCVNVGSVIEREETEALELIRNGFAEPVEDSKKGQKALAEAQEKEAARIAEITARAEALEAETQDAEVPSADSKPE
jgi:hypothetical protein